MVVWKYFFQLGGIIRCGVMARIVVFSPSWSAFISRHSNTFPLWFHCSKDCLQQSQCAWTDRILLQAKILIIFRGFLFLCFLNRETESVSKDKNFVLFSNEDYEKKEGVGRGGHRSRYLAPAKRALYHLS